MEQCLEAIAAADFISLDMEFSGLFTSAKKCSNLDDFYRHITESVQKFLCLQLGVCCGRRRPDSAASGSSFEWVLDPFNFYVFPSRRKIHSIDTCSLSWLRSQGFDFNDWIERGYDYDRLANIDCPYIRTKEAITTVGVQRVVEKIIDAGKPVIFHNGVLDLLHLYDKFIADLPRDLGDFAVELERLFPGGIYDTKRIAVECHLVHTNPDDPENQRVRYTLDGLSSATSNFEISVKTEESTTPAVANTNKPARPSTAYHLAGGQSTTLNVLRRTLEKKLGRHLKLTVESNVTTTYDLKLRILPSSLSPDAETTTEPPSSAEEPTSSPNKRARIDPLAADREHEAGFDAMLTMHLFLLELELLLNKSPVAIDGAKNGLGLIGATSMKKAKDRLECKGVPLGVMDLGCLARKTNEKGNNSSSGHSAGTKGGSHNPLTAATTEESSSGGGGGIPIFKNKTL